MSCGIDINCTIPNLELQIQHLTAVVMTDARKTCYGVPRAEGAHGITPSNLTSCWIG